MSTHKIMDRICAVAIAVAVIVSLALMGSVSSGSGKTGKTKGYESTLFDTSRVHTIDIVMNDWDSFIETCESEEYSPCAVVIDGENYKNVGIRAKGNTSLSSVRTSGSQRYSFKIEFDHYQSGKTYYGLDKLCLNNLIQDNTMMKDYLVYRMMAEFGADSPLCSFVYIRVNGEDWGLYLALEGVEDSFLARNYGSGTGELYKPDSMSFGGGRGNGRDFDFSDFMNQNFGDSDAGEELTTEESSPAIEDGTQPQGESEAGDGFGASFSGFSGAASGMPDMSGMPQMPEGFQVPEGFDMPGGFNPFESSSEAPGDSEETADAQEHRSRRDGGFGGFGGFSFGMGSSDVKLQYIDDNPESYANIFDNAKTDVNKADQKRLIASLKQLNEYREIDSVVDVDEVMRYFVIHNFVRNGDSYTGAIVHNYYLYEKDGKLSMIPWDYNLAFGTFQSGNASSEVNADIDNPVSGSNSDRPMLNWIFEDETYTAQYHALFREFLDTWFSDGQLAAYIADTAEMIRPYVESDPSKFCTLEEFDTAVDTLTQFVTLRAESVQQQLDGEDTAIDTSSLDLSLMGSMGENGGGPGGFPGGNFPQMPENGSMPDQIGGFSMSTQNSGWPTPGQNDSFSFPGFNSQNNVSATKESMETEADSNDQEELHDDSSSFAIPDRFPGKVSRADQQNIIVMTAVCAGILLVGILFVLLYRRRSRG